MTKNQKRADYAARAILYHTQLSGGEDGNRKDGLVDLLTNLMHMQGEGQDDFDGAFYTARSHYEAETSETDRIEIETFSKGDL